MGGEIVRRGAAVGAALGLAAAGETVRINPALRADSVFPALQIASLCVASFGAIGIALGLLFAGSRRLGRDGSRLRTGIERIASARSLWPLAVLAAAFAVWNEVVRADASLAPLRHAGRFALGAGALLVIGLAISRPRPVSRRTRRLETALAFLLVPALVGTLSYSMRALPPAAGPEDVLALAPRFEPEPADALALANAAGRSRVLLIGVDGASWDRIERGIAAGRLPTFAKLRDVGVAAPLRSAEPTYSPRLWTSIATGVAPEQHGVEDFYLLQLPRLGIESFRLRRSLGLMRQVLERSGELRFVPVTSSLRRSKALWNLADEAGLRSAVIGLWATWPPEPLRHGVVVSDHASVARQQEWLDRKKTSERAHVTTWPPELAASLAALQRAPDSVSRDELGRFVAVDDATWSAFEATHHFSKEVPLSAFRSSHLNDAFHAAAAKRLWNEQAPDLLFVYLRAVDELSHFFYEAGVPEAAALGFDADTIRRFGGVVDAAYAATDQAIAPLVDAALASPDTLVVLVSDHGWEREPDGRYNHNFAPPGILVLAGAGVCETSCAALDDPSIYDIAPTVLERLGLPLSKELVGRPLREAFAAPRDSRVVATYGARVGTARAVASGADAALREKLEALGYVKR